MMRQLQEESLETMQCIVEESTHQVVKEVVFDDEYEPLEEFEPYYEEKEPFKVVLGQTLGLDSQVESEEHFEGCLEEFLFQDEVHESLESSSSSYILYELEPTNKFFFINLIMPRKVLLSLCAENFHIKSSRRTFTTKTHM